MAKSNKRKRDTLSYLTKCLFIHFMPNVGRSYFIYIINKVYPYFPIQRSSHSKYVLCHRIPFCGFRTQ